MILKAHLSVRSQPAYQRAWDTFRKFCADYSVDCNNPSPTDFVLFLSFLKISQYSPASISTMASQIGYVFHLKGLSNPCSHLFVKKALSGLQKLNPQINSRLPITIDILRKLIISLDFLFTNDYKVRLFRAMFSLSFFGFLRPGEIAPRTALSKVLTLNDAAIHGPPSSGLHITFRDYKHNTGNRPFILHIAPHVDPKLCPVNLLADYLAVRVTSSKCTKASVPLFVQDNGNPVSSSLFATTLRDCILSLGLDPTSFKSHSWRIGAASWAASRGFSDDHIRKLGRWKSDAFKKYIRNSLYTI